MSRPLRIIYPNACYHVMNRGAAKQNIFNNNQHRLIFLDLLRECCEIFNINIYAYCLMSNHYHLLLSTPDANLPRMMRHLNGVYTQKYNRLEKRDGPLFRGRYLAKLVDEDCYRLLLTRYIHLNPVAAGLVKKPAQYRWSSYRAYLGFITTDWLSIKTIIQQLQNTTSLSHIESYQDYVEITNLDEINIFLSTKFISPIVGSESFIRKSLEKIEAARLESYSADVNKTKSIPSIQFIMEHVNSYYQIDYETLINKKSGKRNFPKLAFIYLCYKEFGHTLKNIAKFVKFLRYESVSASVRKCQQELKNSQSFRNEINFMVAQLKNEKTNIDQCDNT